MTASTPKAVNECAFCGKPSPTTRDHIPPKNLFPIPRAADLITVPCCEECRLGWSADDEYFRLVVISACEGLRDERVERVNETVIRSLQRPKAEGFAQYVRQTLSDLEIVSKGGIYLGNVGGMAVDHKRVCRVAGRITRGLFWHEKRYPLPDGYEVKSCVGPADFGKILDELGSIPYADHRTVADNAFSYTFCHTDQDPNSMVWLYLLYDLFPFGGLITKKPKCESSEIEL